MVNAGILLVNDNPLFREGLRCVLAARCFNIVGEAPTYQAALELLETQTVAADVVLGGPGPAGGFEIISEMTRRFPSTRVVVLSDWLYGPWIELAIASGAVGFLSQDISSEALMHALNLVLTGERIVATARPCVERSAWDLVGRPAEDPADTILATLADQVAILPARPCQDTQIDSAPVVPLAIPQLTQQTSGDADATVALASLSRREGQILECLVDGLPNKLIARNLEMAEATVKVHLKALLRKLSARNRTQAAILAIRNNFRRVARNENARITDGPAPVSRDRSIELVAPPIDIVKLRSVPARAMGQGMK